MTDALMRDLEAVARIPAVPTILDVISRTTSMGFVVLARVTEGRWMACGVKDTMQLGLDRGGELNVETTICRDIRRHRRPVIIDDVERDDLYRRHPAPLTHGFHSFISVPVVLPDGTFFGTLSALDRRPRLLSAPETVSSFELYAELIALQLDVNLRLVETEISLQTATEVSKLREQFIAVLGHDLRNPLASVAAGARLLTRKPERTPEIVANIESSIARMSGLIDDVLDFARGRLGNGLALNLDNDVPIRVLIEEVVQELQSAHPDRVIDIECEADLPVVCDRARVAQLLSNLLGNALTHGATSGPIKVRALARDLSFELSVANPGEPIARAAMAQMFQPFFRAKAGHRRDGLGLGLFIASEIARAHGGSLVVTSDVTETRFSFKMPTAALVLDPQARRTMSAVGHFTDLRH